MNAAFSRKRDRRDPDRGNCQPECRNEKQRQRDRASRSEEQRRASALFEEHKETDKQINQANEIDVEDPRRPLVNCIEIVEVSPVEAPTSGIRRAFDQVVDLAADAGLIEINLHVARVIVISSALLPLRLMPINRRPAATSPLGRRVAFDSFGDDAFVGVDPLDAVPGGVSCRAAGGS